MNAIEKNLIATLQQVAAATSTNATRQLELTAAIQCIAGLRSGALLSLRASEAEELLDGNQAIKPQLEDLPLAELLAVAKSAFKKTASMSQLKLLDVVALLVDVQGWNLDNQAVQVTRGHVGTVVEVEANDSEVVIVEFADTNGQAYVLASVACKNLLALRYQ